MAKPKQSATELYQQARSGSRRALGRLLTMVERGGPDADLVSDLSHQDSGQAHIVGITGAPGSGKSTLVGQLVQLLAAHGKTPAVLAVDPSSPLTGGAILGDRIRMDEGDASSASFIRSMATRGHSGGLAVAVPSAIRLFDAVGYDPVLVETVGVGQVEVDVVGAADTAVVVMTPGMGDAVQANKAGLLEVADLFVVNKADRPGANDVRRDLDLMLDLSHMTGQEDSSGYRPPIIMSSAIDGDGVDTIWAATEDHLAMLGSHGRLDARRRHRVQTEIEAIMKRSFGLQLQAAIDSATGRELIESAKRGDLSPSAACVKLMSELKV